MKTIERNKHLRELANDIASATAKAIGLRHTPKCARITRRRGAGNAYSFTVPFWASRNTDYFVYYVAHEVCHAVSLGHGPTFRKAELTALNHFGLTPVYSNSGKGPYVHELIDVTTGKTIVKATDAGANPKTSQP